MNDIETAEKLEYILTDASSVKENDEKGKNSKPTINESLLKSYEERYHNFKSSLKYNPKIQNYIRSMQQSYIEQFWRSNSMVKKCENCGFYSPGLRKDGFTKIFIKATPKRMRDSIGSTKVLNVG